MKELMNRLPNRLLNNPANRLGLSLRKGLANSPAGVTSLLFVLAISLVLIVMVGGIAALTVREQQQASNTELSNRALQTAEAGVKAAVAKLSATPTYSKPDCSTTVGDSTFTDISATGQTITCATVTSYFTTTYEGFLETDRTTQFIFAPSASTDTPYYLKLSWNAPSLGDVSAAAAAFGGSLYPDAGATYENAAMVEMNIVYWPKTNITATSFKNVTLLFAPNKITTDANNPITNSCGTGTYSCTTTNATDMSGFSIATATGILAADVGKYNYAIRITPRYKGTHFALTGYQTGGATIAPAQSNKAQIDITAKVGNLYRRVKAEKIITPSAIETIFTSVLYAGRGPSDASSYGICKTAAIYTNSNTTAPTWASGDLAAGNIGPDCP